MEVEPLRAAPDRVEKFVRLCGCEHEHDVLGGFFERLEQGVARSSRQHVSLVQDVDAAGAFGGCDRAHVHSDLPNVLDLVV